ncbi:MAG TPA: porin [Ramlibacter sp.]|nr:porin [Ramlibacter sp.]
MGKTFRPLLAALMTAGLATGAAHAQWKPELKVSGFGTLGVVHSDEDQADFVGTIFQPNGAGFTRSTAVTPDTKLGVQVDAIFNDRFSAVLQLVSQQRHDNGFKPNVEWANVKFQATPELSVRAGRIAAPSFLYSDTRMVGYTQPWIRPPVEVYGVLPITNNDGLDLIYRRKFGSTSHTLQAFYGRTTARLRTGEVESAPSWGINDTMQWGDWTMRAGYAANEVDLNMPTLRALVGGFNAFTAVPGPIGAQAATLAQRYRTNDLSIGAFSLSASYDPGKWFVMSEFVQFRGESILADSRSWYVAGGWRLGSFTPYAMYARTSSDVAPEPGLPLPAAAPLNAGLNAAMNNQFNGSQSTATLGVRWDAMKNTALKLQYDHTRLGSGSAGRFANVQPAFQRGGSVNLFSVALDFVF